MESHPIAKQIAKEEWPYYARQIGLPKFGRKGQERLKAAKVLVVGAGGLGSPALYYLAAAGVGCLGICDFDEVAVSNLHRQILFQWEDLKKPKVQVAAQRLKELNPWVETKTYVQKPDQDNVQQLLEEFQVVLDCSDNFATKFFLHDACFRMGKDLVQASIYQYEGQLQVFRFSDGDLKNRPCLRCLWPQVPPENCTGTCQQVGVMGMVPGVFGSLQALETVKLLLQLPSLENGETLIMDLMSLQSQRVSWKINPDCPLHQGHGPLC